MIKKWFIKFLGINEELDAVIDFCELQLNLYKVKIEKLEKKLDVHTIVIDNKVMRIKDKMNDIEKGV